MHAAGNIREIQLADWTKKNFTRDSLYPCGEFSSDLLVLDKLHVLDHPI